MSADNENSGASVSVPMSAVATALMLGIVGIAYLLTSRQSTETPTTVADRASQVTRSGRGALRKVGLTALIALIENDATRKVVVAALKAMAKRG